MLRTALLATVALVGGCRYSLENTNTGGDDQVDAAVSAACLEAKQHSDLTFIETVIFKPSCEFSGCHNGVQGSAAGRLDIRPGQAFAHLVNVDSNIDTSRKLVVPGEPTQSYLLMMIQQIPPSGMTPPAAPPPDDIGYMPQTSNSVLCAEKRDAIQRWIVAGAPMN